MFRGGMSVAGFVSHPICRTGAEDYRSLCYSSLTVCTLQCFSLCQAVYVTHAPSAALKGHRMASRMTFDLLLLFIKQLELILQRAETKTSLNNVNGVNISCFSKGLFIILSFITSLHVIFVASQGAVCLNSLVGCLLKLDSGLFTFVCVCDVSLWTHLYWCQVHRMCVSSLEGRRFSQVLRNSASEQKHTLQRHTAVTVCVSSVKLQPLDVLILLYKD